MADNFINGVEDTPIEPPIQASSSFPSWFCCSCSYQVPVSEVIIICTYLVDVRRQSNVQVKLTYSFHTASKSSYEPVDIARIMGKR